ncbi:transcription termination factor Rho [Phycicoccus sp. SLBN-51]|uniref:transcription termination factor Rho n=1 Tax=Phycicoccus sp. SLBN-51 TaxID=2768447 RepID=UPI001154E631|nr:transcription termination factor Rho [Phycicoccus sp. SLBN-51]TQJ49896.1 transcription termination factor Rho [Phycicoccus sp. SLBN-51]
MTDTTTLDAAQPGGTEKPRRSGALSTMRLAELQGLASSMGITGTAKMRKGDLITAIKARQSGSAPAAAPATAPTNKAEAAAPRVERAQNDGAQNDGAQDRARQVKAAPDAAVRQERQERQDRQQGGERPAAREAAEQAPAQRAEGAERQPRQREERPQREDRPQREERQDRGEAAQGEQARESRRERDDRGQRDAGGQRGDRARQDRGERTRQDRDERTRQDRDDRTRQDNDERGGDRTRQEREERSDRGDNRNRQDRQDRDERADNTRANRDDHNTRDTRDEDDSDGRGRRRSRSRNRGRDKRRGGREDYENEPMVAEDDILVPVAGILDVLENYAFVRTSGYLPGPSDVYVPLGLVKKNGLRKGDAVTGAVKAQSEEQQQNSRQKFNALVRLDTVNGMTPDDAKKRVEFGKLTPLYPQQRLRLETDPTQLTTRIIDLVAPIGKGQRGLIVAPAKAGKTMVMQAIANAITTNNPECHLMVVLVDERPEEVTDMQRAVKGEVISSTFDRPADDHTTVAELAIERAKRLVEMGHDVVVLLDSITKLGRAYNLSAPASGRILSGGVDSAALYPPKKFFGAARNIEDGGSLTILATALVETGSRMDEVIFEEFKGTGNMELKLDRGLANRRIFPAVDVNASGTRREEILLSGEELKIMWKLRRVLAALDQQQGIELLIDRLKKTKSNIEFLMQVQQTSSIHIEDEDTRR